MIDYISRFIRILLCAGLCYSTAAKAAVIELHVPVVEDSPKQHRFFHELLETALRDAGHTPKLTVSSIPQLRIKRFLKSGEVSIFWMLATEERNKEYRPISQGLTNGLIGKRVLLIRPEDQLRFDLIKNAEDFARYNLIAGMGRDWFDSDIWKYNQIPFREHSGNWESIFKMIVKKHGYDYISRGLNEVFSELSRHPNLHLEEHLLLSYPKDYQFYLSPKWVAQNGHQVELLTNALQQAQVSGLIDRLINKYWQADLKKLSLDRRKEIVLRLPPG